jgi:uncharacterized protein with HEPN domain
LEAISDIRRYTAGADEGLTSLARVNYDAALFAILKITEAVRNLPEELKAKRPDMSWSDMVRTGNLLRHNYFRIDRGIIADIVRNDLPALEFAAQSFWRDLGLGEVPEFD